MTVFNESRLTMTSHITLALAVLIGVSQYAGAQTDLVDDEPPQLVASRVEPVGEVRVILAMRRIMLRDAFVRMLHERRMVKPLPELGESSVLDEQQAALVLAAAGGERHEIPVEQALKLEDGKQYEWSLVTATKMLRSGDTVRATLSDDGKTVQIELTWAPWKNGSQGRLPTTDIAVPLGSHLVIHTARVSEGKSDFAIPPLPVLPSLPPIHELDQFADKLLGAPKPKTELQQLYLVVTPSLAYEERPAAKPDKK